MLKVAIIGKGIVSKLFLFNLLRDLKCKKIEDISFDVYYDDLVFTENSLNSSSIVSKYGAQKGISSLGDLICDSFDYADEFISNHLPTGITRGEYVHINSLDKKEDFIRRFGRQS